ncbi:Uncharacterized protein OBRU01_16235 [Operophtera brumata]|uniref:Uncharacterized protein n=1 Tax=Operophtera brumata TaxID=104452 RepID=A0A0L7L3G9_OPEBR|nr:Uncharacterized protein OBRU01_16235 [Operophtera brumata]
MYPADLNQAPLQLNPFTNKLDHNIMLKTIQSLCYKNQAYNMTSPFLVDNILHQQKTAELHNQYLNQQLESYMLQRQGYARAREDSPDADEAKTETEEDKQESIDDDETKSRDGEEGYPVKSELYYTSEYYQRNEEKEVLNIPNLNRRCLSCGSADCPPFTCKKSGIRRLEELEKRFNLNSYQETNSDEDTGRERHYHEDTGRERHYHEDTGRSCEEFHEQKKPLLKFSVSAILGDRDAPARTNLNGESVLRRGSLQRAEAEVPRVSDRPCVGSPC